DDVAQAQAELRRRALQRLDDVGVVVVDVDQRRDLRVGEHQHLEGIAGRARWRQRDVEAAVSGIGDAPEHRQAVVAASERAIGGLDREHHVAPGGLERIAAVRGAAHDRAAVGEADAADALLAGIAHAVAVDVLEHGAGDGSGGCERRAQQQDRERGTDHPAAPLAAASTLPSATSSSAVRTSRSSARSCSRKAMRSRIAACAAATARPGCASPSTMPRRRSRAWAAVISSSASTLPRSSTMASTWRASLAPMDTWSSALAEVGIEYTEAGIARVARSLTIAAAVYC